MEKRKENKKTILIFVTSVLVILGLTFCILIMIKPTKVSGILDTDPEKKGSFKLLVAGRDDAAGLCDSLMIASFDRDRGSALVLQIPRDTYASYTEGSYKKINGAPSYLGGMENFCDFLETSMGIELDGYVSFDLEALSEIVDAVGGVEIDVPFDMKYSDPYQELYINIPKGKNHLDGEAAEMLVRYRSGYVRGDLDRLDTQKLFMMSLFSRVKEENKIALLLELLPSLEHFETDLSFAEIATLSAEAMELSDQEIEFVTLPGSEAVAGVSGASYYVAARESTERLLEEYFASSGFDREKVFLNTNYKEFEQIYYENRQKGT